ncbi:MAG: hypothetical protein GWP10_21860 [Nitrospiraceae bacterium]|nr:hypothetical protein [Nitrospiraceae bacterium]
MNRTDDALGKAFYLNRIKSLETKSYIIQISVMVGVGFFLSLLQGASLKPFYFPLEYFSYVVFIMLLAMAGESFFFTILEIKNQDTDGGKYFTAKKASKNALKIVVIAIVLIALFANPISEKMLESASTEREVVHMQNGTASFEFSSVDRFSLIKHSVEIKGRTYSGEYDVYVIYSSLYSPNMTDYRAKARYISSGVSALRDMRIYPPDTGSYTEYTVLLKGNGTGDFTINIIKDVKNDFVIYTSIFLVSVAVIHAWWFVYLQRYVAKYGTELVSL